jgi:hypothetical protein
MNESNALGFLLLGLGMLWLPVLAPGLVPPSPLWATSTRELWLLFMGTLNTALGGGVLGWQAMLNLWSVPAWIKPGPAPLPAMARARV